MIDYVIKEIEKHMLIDRKDIIVAGVSGGPDSVCLLHVLCCLRESMDLKLYAVHINHMMRDLESDEDERYVKGLCDKLNIGLKCVSIDIRKLSKERGLSLEETGREERYRLFNTVADNVMANKIAVAHNKNDQAETVLMNIMRGSGLDGLKGMDYKRGRVIRPLLNVERHEIEDYCIINNLNPRIDSSNLESIYTRNKIRLELIPCIDKLFGGHIVNSIGKMSALIKDDSDFIEQCIKELMNKVLIKMENGKVTLNLFVLQECHLAAKKRLIRNYIKVIKGNIKGIENVHIEKVCDLIENGRVGKELHLPDYLRVKKSYETLCVYMYKEESTKIDFDIRVKIPGITVVGECGHSIQSQIVEGFDIRECSKIKNNSKEQYFDYDKLFEGINVRNRRQGDVFKPLKSNGTKKLKEYFIDNKIPKDVRDKIPLITLNAEVVWIVGYKISDKFKVTENTKRVLRLGYI